MEPAKKAIELINKFKPYMYCYIGSGMFINKYDEDTATKFAKKCAIIAVDEIIATDMLIDDDIYVETVSYLPFWIDVKKELEKM